MLSDELRKQMRREGFCKGGDRKQNDKRGGIILII